MTDFEMNGGSIVEQREYTDEEMHALIDGTMTDFDEGDLVSGVVVKVERDEVLLDIGYKSEGVIPARELSIRKDANPADIVSCGDEIEALAKRLVKAGYKTTPGKPRAGENTVLNALQAAVGKSKRQIQNILSKKVLFRYAS